MGQREVGVPWSITTAPPDTHGQGKEPKIGITQHPASTVLSTRQDPTPRAAWGTLGVPAGPEQPRHHRSPPFFFELLPTLRKGGLAGERFPAGMAGTVPMTTQPPLPQPHLLPLHQNGGCTARGGCSAPSPLAPRPPPHTPAARPPAQPRVPALGPALPQATGPGDSRTAPQPCS